MKTVILTHSDSICGEHEILIKNSGKVKRVKIGKFIDGYAQKNDEKERIFVNGAEILTYEKGKIIFSPIKRLIRHKVKKDIYEIRTSSGNTIKVTGDHSVFVKRGWELKPVEARTLKKGEYIAGIRKINIDAVSKKINLLDYPEILKKHMIKGRPVEKILTELIQTTKKMRPCTKKNNRLARIRRWKNKRCVPVITWTGRAIRKNYSKGMRLYRENGKDVQIEIPVDKSLATLMGLWIADGSYCGSKRCTFIRLSCPEEAPKKIAQEVASRFSARVCRSKNDIDFIITSTVLGKLFKQLGLMGNSSTKRIPAWVFELPEKQIASVLKGYFSGDGTVSKGNVKVDTRSKKLADDIRVLLLRLGIISSKRSFLSSGGYSKKKKPMYRILISSNLYKDIFLKRVGFLQKAKNQKIYVGLRGGDIIPVSRLEFEQLNLPESIKKRHRHLKRSQISRKSLLKLLRHSDNKKACKIVNGDIAFNKIESISKVPIKENFVYDIEANGTFISENLLLKNSDGMCSGAILLSAFPRSHVFFTKPVSLLDDLRHTRADRILIADMALNKRDAPEILKEMKNKKIAFYCDEHPHPDNIDPKELERLCDVYIHQEGASSSEIAYRHFQDRIPGERIWPALYGAIADYAGETPFVKERLRNWDIRGIYFEVSTLVLGIKMDAFNSYDAKRDIVKVMAKGGNPSDIFGLVNAAKSAAGKEFQIYKMIKKKAESSGSLGYILDLPYFGFRGPSAIFAAAVRKKPIGISAHTRRGHIDITMRARDTVYPLHKLAEKAAMKAGGSGGGIPEAAGARIPKGQFDVFLKEANIILKEESS